MVRKIRRVCIITLITMTIGLQNSYAGLWTQFNKAHQPVKQKLPRSVLEKYTIGTIYDYVYVNDIMILKMRGARWAGRVSLGALLSYGIGIASGLIVPTKGLTVAQVAGHTFAGSLLDSYWQNLPYINITEGLMAHTVEEFEQQLQLLKTEWGISDYFLFADGIPKGSSSPTPHPLAVGAIMQIQLNERNTDEPYAPPIILLKDPFIDFSALRANLIEYNAEGKVQPTTIPFVFAYEKFNGKPIEQHNGQKLQKIAVKPNYPKVGSGGIVGQMSLTRHNKLGWAGLREVHLYSPINQGMACKKGNDDFGFTIILNQRTAMVQGPSAPRQVGDELRIAVYIQGFHDNRVTLRGIDGMDYQWKGIADHIFSAIHCRGAGVTRTHFYHTNMGTQLYCAPKKPGRIDVVIDTLQGPVVFPNIATVVGGGLAGYWQLRRNNSIIRIVYVPENDRYRAVLEVDKLQYFHKGDLMWRDIRASSTEANRFSGTEYRGDGKGGTVTSPISLTLREDTLIYREGNEVYYFDRTTPQAKK